MKKITLVLATLLVGTIGLSNQAKAQDGYTKFKWHIMSLGYAIPSGEGSKGGIIIGTEPTYLIKDNISVGLKLESALTAKESNGDSKIAAVGSYLLTGDYYFSQESTSRFFAGAGLGFGSAAAIGTENNSSLNVGSSSGFAGLVRAGADLGHFRFSLSYNLMPSSKTNTLDFSNLFNPTITEKTISNSYLGFGISVFIGGGKK